MDLLYHETPHMTRTFFNYFSHQFKILTLTQKKCATSSKIFVDSCRLLSYNIRQGGKRAMWSEKDIQFLFNNPNMSIANIARALGKSESAVKSKRSRLGIRSEDMNPWTADERRILQFNYEKGKTELMKLLPGRSWDAIRSQVQFLRNRQWSI